MFGEPPDGEFTEGPGILVLAYTQLPSKACLSTSWENSCILGFACT